MFPFPSLVDLDNMSKGQKLSFLATAIPVVLLLRFAVQLYQARMKFRRLRSQGIVCLLFRRNNLKLTSPANRASLPTIGSFSHCDPILQRLGLRRQFHPDLWLLHE